MYLAQHDTSTSNCFVLRNFKAHTFCLIFKSFHVKSFLRDLEIH